MGKLLTTISALEKQIYYVSISRVLSVKSGPSRGMKVCVKSLQKEGLPSLSAVTDPKWKVVGGDFQDIDLDKIDGRNVAAKLELLMATLSKAEPH